MCPFTADDQGQRKYRVPDTEDPPPPTGYPAHKIPTYYFQCKELK
jgi:hypothetical protein